jgi:hypothetical protein
MKGAKYERLGIPPDDAQFLETRKFQIEEVARWYNLAPYKLRRTEGSASYASIEQQSIEYVTDTLDPHWVDWEQELRIKLIAPLERTQQTIEHQREGRLRGDAASRGEFHSKLFSVGSITQNEIRKNENLNALSDDLEGDIPYRTVQHDSSGSRARLLAGADRQVQPRGAAAPTSTAAPTWPHAGRTQGRPEGGTGS